MGYVAYLHTKNWLSNEHLRACSPAARIVLFDLMCLGYEGTPYGYLADTIGPLRARYIAARLVITEKELTDCVEELQAVGWIVLEGAALSVLPALRVFVKPPARAAGVGL